ncbi:MAG TPA: hypothetical protein VK661_01780 [Planctomycetota bacterium]|nr:hypothetical protein [Planctomycetota bacterium]
MTRFIMSVALLLPEILTGLGRAQEAPAQEGAVRTVIHRAGESIPIAVPLSEAAKHRVTILSFPEPVARAIVPWGEEDISIETDGREVVLKLLRAVEGDLVFRGRSGTLYRIRVSPAKGNNEDGFIRIVLPSEKPETPPVPAQAKSGAIDLLRSMRLGEIPANAKVTAAPESVIHESADFLVRPRLLYVADVHEGLVLELVNRRKDGNYRVDLSQFTAERLVLVGARELVIPPGRSTRIYLVFWK